MKQDQISLRGACALLLAAAALPFSPAVAQQAAPPAEPPSAEAPAAEAPADPPVAKAAPVRPAPVEPAPPAPISRPVDVDPPAVGPEAITAPPPPGTARTTPAPGSTVTTSPAPPIGTSAPTSTVPAADIPPADISTMEPEVLPEPAPVETTGVRTVAANDPRGGPMLLWLLGGLLLGGALTWLLLQRRRRGDAHLYRERVRPIAAPVQAPTAPMPAAAPLQPVAAAVPAAEPAAVAAPVAPEALPDPTPAASAVAAAPLGVAAAAAEPPATRPWLNLLVRPLRAGIADGEARVEFALDVANQGDAPARDVRVSTWMFPAGTGQESEIERMLIERRADDAALPPTTIDAGHGQRIEATVALTRGEIRGDTLLPVVVAEARYRLPDGSEGRTAASFAVGVPDGEELAHFDLAHPSGLHEDVEARLLGEPERA